MKRITSITIIIISILLVGLYTVASTYSVIINVVEKDGITEIVNKVTIKDLLTNDNGTYNNTYYTVKNEIGVTESQADILMNSDPLNDVLQIVLESIVEYKVHNNLDAKLSNDALYKLISDGVVNTKDINDELKSKIINKASIYKNDISDYIYDIEVSLLGVSPWTYI